MGMTEQTLRGKVGAALAATTVGGAAVVLLLTPSATAAPDPCAASQVAKTVGTVANNTGLYLDSHPETNDALTEISQQPAGPQTLGSLKAYFDANPEAAKDMQSIQQPLTALTAKCKLPISLPQVMGLMQAAQQGGGGLPAGLPAGLPGAQTVSVPGAGAAGPAPGPSRLPGPATS